MGYIAPDTTHGKRRRRKKGARDDDCIGSIGSSNGDIDALDPACAGPDCDDVDLEPAIWLGVFHQVLAGEPGRSVVSPAAHFLDPHRVADVPVADPGLLD